MKNRIRSKNPYVAEVIYTGKRTDFPSFAEAEAFALKTSGATSATNHSITNSGTPCVRYRGPLTTVDVLGPF